ncbi:transglutaminase domain protein [Enhygromyxa salina]|uniref:Transglutaminase domain protein n=1 Tax=Enhygromyxa salina TaxID=215803 RepID=A0A0C1ZLK6_9BACT|nr:transglutaminase domain protein [Enhygromyxa salina]
MPLLALLGFAPSGCSFARVDVATQFAELDDALVGQRIALGSPEDFRGDSDGSRAREGARVALALGNHDEAAAFARAQLLAARGRYAIARLESADEAELERVMGELDEAARFAVGIGDAVLDGSLVLEAAQFMAAPRRERKAIARAVRLTGYASIAWGYDRLWEAMRGDEASRAGLQRLRGSSGPSAESGAERAAQLAPKTLAKLGPVAVDLLWGQAHRASEAHDSELFAARVQMILRADPIDVDALAAQVALAALDRGAFEADPELLPDLSPDGADPLGAHARMLLRHRGAPDCLALALVRARFMLRDGGFGDAGQLLESVADAPATADERQLADALMAMVELETGTEAGRSLFSSWYRRARARRSTSVSSWLSAFDAELAPAGHVALAREASTQLVTEAKGHGLPRSSMAALVSAARSSKAPRRARNQALAAAVGQDPDFGGLLTICHERGLVDEDCAELVEELAPLQWGEEEFDEALDALAVSPNTRATWFAPVQWLDLEQRSAALEQLEAFADTRVAMTTGYQTSALWAEITTGELERARARLARFGSLLTDSDRLFAQLVFDDFDAGRISVEQLGSWSNELLTDHHEAARMLSPWQWQDLSQIAETFKGPSHLARVARGLGYARRGAFDVGAAELAPLLDELNGPVQIAIASRLALAADLAGNARLRDRALAIAEADGEPQFLPTLVRARIAEAAGDTARAHALYLELLRLDPRSTEALDASLRTLGAQAEKLEASQAISDVLLALPQVYWKLDELIEARATGKIDEAQLTTVWLTRDDPEAVIAHPELAASLPTFARRGYFYLQRQLRGQTSLADAKVVAAQQLAWLDALAPKDRAAELETELWLTYLLGDDAGLAQVHAKTPQPYGYRRSVEPLHAALRMAEIRARGALDPELEWAIVQRELFNANPEPLLERFLAPLTDPGLAAYACNYLADLEDPERGIERCVELWLRTSDPFIAKQLAYLALNEPERARARGLDLTQFFTTAAASPALQRDPWWLYYESLWHTKQGDHTRGANTRIAQLGLGSVAREVMSSELLQAQMRGPLLRQQTFNWLPTGDPRAQALAAISALRGLDLDAADRYAQRMLAWLPAQDPDDPEATPRFVHHQAWMLNSVALAETEDEAELRAIGLLTLSLSALIRDDLDQRKIPRDAMIEILRARGEARGPQELEALAQAHPNSHVLEWVRLVSQRGPRVTDQTRARARSLVALHPDNPLIMLDALPLLSEPGELEASTRALAHARLAQPDHFWLSDAVMPTRLTGADDGLPDWIRSAEAFDRALARVDDASIAKLEPVRHARVDTSAELFFPAALTLDANRLGVSEPLTSTKGGKPKPQDEDEDEDEDEAPPEAIREQWVLHSPRDTRCMGMDCAEEWFDAWFNNDYSLLWSREIELHGGPAIEFAVARRDRVVHSLIMPTGGSVFVLITRTTPEDLAGLAPRIKLARDSVRPLDWSVSAGMAEALRGYSVMPDALTRLRGRASLSAARPGPKPSCPLAADARDGLDPRREAGLLLDLFLATRDPWQRRALLACTTPQAPAAEGVALASLLDADPDLHEFGRQATATHPERVLTDARRVLYDQHEQAVSNPALTAGNKLAPYGLLQVLTALPPAEAQQLSREMLGGDTRVRALALAASAVLDEFEPLADGEPNPGRVDLESLRAVLREGTHTNALLAANSLAREPGPKDLALLRERADALSKAGIATKDDRGLAMVLAVQLGSVLDRQDRKRLQALIEAVDRDPADGDKTRASSSRRALESVLEDYDRGRKLLSKGDLLAGSRAADWARARATKTAPRSRQQLRDLSLPELAPGHQWSYFRVGQLGLFVASIEDLLRRLAPGSGIDTTIVRALVTELLVAGPFTLLRESGGLDTRAAIDCVSPGGDRRFACSATVLDRAAVLEVLGRREAGEDAGVATPMAMSLMAVGLPLVAGVLPVFLQDMLEAPLESNTGGSARLTSERVRLTRTIAGHQLEQYATVSIFDNQLLSDSELYMFIDDRLLVFSDQFVAERILRELPRGVESLAASSAFATVVSDWHDGAALQSLQYQETLAQFSIEVAFDSEGLAFSGQVVGKSSAAGDLGALAQLMPASPVSLAGLAFEPDDLDEMFDGPSWRRCRGHVGAGPLSIEQLRALADGEEPCGLAATDKLPPIDVVAQGSAVLLGWYPDVGHSLWQDWVLAVPRDANLRKALQRAGLGELEPGHAKQHDGLWWLIRDGALFVASTPELAAAVEARPAPTITEGADPFGLFRVDGARAAKVVRELAQHYPGQSREYGVLGWASILGLMRQSEVRADWDASDNKAHSRANFSAKVSLNLTESEQDLALIDQWVASPEVQNASMLPRSLGRHELASTLVYHLRVDDAEGFARRTLRDGNPRITAEVIDEDELRLTVLPSLAVPTSTRQELVGSERQRMLELDSRIRADDEQLRKIVKKLQVAGDDEATVAAVVAWAHEHIQYELTPNSPNVVELIERGKGDCTEYALLTVTLLRIAGIPARLEEGMSAGGADMGAHAWSAWHDGQRWHEIDATAGTTTVGSGHLRLPVVDVLARISLGQFEVLAVEAAAR